MARQRRALAGEAAFSLPELLVAMAIALIIAAGAGTLVAIALRSEPRISEPAGQIQKGRTMLERITRELRQGDEVENGAANGLRVHTWVDGAECGGTPGVTVNCWIEYACSGTTCTRTPDGRPTVQVVEGISDPAVFCYELRDAAGSCPAAMGTDPDFVGMRLTFPDSNGGEGVTLDDGIVLRNKAR